MKKMIFSLVLAGMVTFSYGFNSDGEVRSNYVETSEAYADAYSSSAQLINNFIGFAHDDGGYLGPREGWYLIASYPPTSSLYITLTEGRSASFPSGQTVVYWGSTSTQWPPYYPSIVEIWPDSDNTYRYTW